MSDIQQIAQRYIDVWNETDPARRRALVEEVFTEDSGYTDPLGEVRGWAGIDEFIAGAQAQFAGMRFSLGGDVDAHHDTARFHWHLNAPGAEEPVVIGFDVVAAENGRLRQVYGFLDKIPA
jgi:hypothetical protein